MRRCRRKKAPARAGCPRAGIPDREPLPLHGILVRNGYRHRNELGGGVIVTHLGAA